MWGTRVNATRPASKSPAAFFLLLVALGIPIIVFANVEVFPNVPLFTFGALLPVTTALILSYRENKIAGMLALLQRAVDFKRIKSRIWYLPILFTWPFIVVLQCGLAILSGLPVSLPHFPVWMPLIIAILFVAALGEELGWMGYVFEPMQDRFGALWASVLLGVIWASIHVPYFIPSGASPSWIMWQLIYITATRVVFVWIYANTGKSVFGIAVMHTLFNAVWLLFPRNPDFAGLSIPSFYDPGSLAVTTIGLAAVVTFLWGPKTFTYYRYARRTASGQA
jgi:membrane protease YdiL (CAAX protease family)